MSNSFHEYQITKVADENQQETKQVRRKNKKKVMIMVVALECKIFI